MTDENTPDDEDTEGHAHRRLEDAGTADLAEDTEGHAHRRIEDAGAETVDDDDTEGHAHRR